MKNVLVMKSLECHKSPAHKPYILQQDPGVANQFYTKGTERLYRTVTVSKWSCSPPSQEGRGEREEQCRVCRPGTPILIPWVGYLEPFQNGAAAHPLKRRWERKGKISPGMSTWYTRMKTRRVYRIVLKWKNNAGYMNWYTSNEQLEGI